MYEVPTNETKNTKLKNRSNLARQVGRVRNTRTLKGMVTMRNLYCTCIIVQPLYGFNNNKKQITYKSNHNNKNH